MSKIVVWINNGSGDKRFGKFGVVKLMALFISCGGRVKKE